MATVLTPARQPFGALNESKLRSLQSLKNRQNAIHPNSAPSLSLKRRAPSPDNTSDSENVDPNLLDSLSKRKRASFDDDVSVSKQSRLYTTVVPSISKPRVFTSTTSMTPRIDTVQKPSSTPLSAPAAAGRSPTRSKSSGLYPRKRLAPPTIGIRSPSLSVAAALKGTLAHKKSKKVRTIEESKPNSWFFEIYEEPEEVQDYRMNEWTMTQSSAALDISDDESKSFDTKDRGKENVDPNEVFAPVTRSMAAAAAKAEAASATSTKDAMMEETRSPLSDLNAADYYGEGLDATSVILVQDDAPVKEAEPKVEAPSIDDFTFEAHLAATPAEVMETSDPVVPIPDWATKSTLSIDAVLDNIDTSGDIEIWESESAKDENEKSELDTALETANGFALQEL